MSSDDIVKRLQVDYVCDEHTWKELEEFALRNEAADVIKARDAEIERLRTAGEWLAIVALGVRPWITPLAAMVERERIDEALAAWNEARHER